MKNVAITPTQQGAIVLNFFIMPKKKELPNKGMPNKVFVKTKHIPKAVWKKKSIISFSFFSSPFGKIVVASMPQGVCYIGYAFSHETVIQELKERFPYSALRHKKNMQHECAKKMFSGQWDKKEKLPLYLKGTEFQLKVWEELLQIPAGALSTYSKIATSIGCPKAQRAVGTAIGKNPILYIIPCHRVIAQNGKMGGFYWGIDKKMELLNVENAGYLHFTS